MLPLIKTTDVRQYVHTADPAVVLTDDAADGDAVLPSGFIPYDPAKLAPPDVDGDAGMPTVVSIRPLNAVEYFAHRAAMATTSDKYGQALVDLCQAGLVGVSHYNGDLVRDMPGPLLDELGALILRISADAA
jgi:hypothetical protein